MHVTFDDLYIHIPLQMKRMHLSNGSAIRNKARDFSSNMVLFNASVAVSVCSRHRVIDLFASINSIH